MLTLSMYYSSFHLLFHYPHVTPILPISADPKKPEHLLLPASDAQSYFRKPCVTNINCLEPRSSPSLKSDTHTLYTNKQTCVCIDIYIYIHLYLFISVFIYIY